MGNRYSLCVGVNNGLEYAEKDAENMYNLFQKLNFKEVRLLLNDNEARLSTVANKGKHVDRDVVTDWIEYFKKKNRNLVIVIFLSSIILVMGLNSILSILHLQK